MVELTAHMVLCRFNSTGATFYFLNLIFILIKYLLYISLTLITLKLITHLNLLWRGGIVDALDLGSNIFKICRFNSVAIRLKF